MLTKEEIAPLKYIRFKAVKEVLCIRESNYIMEAKRYDWHGKHNSADWAVLASDNRWHPIRAEILGNWIEEILEYEMLDD